MKKIINNGIPDAIYQSIINFAKQYDGNIENAISVTTLIDSPLRHYYSKNADIEVNATDELWKLTGSAMHQVLENSDSSNVKELRLKAEHKGINIHGKCDVYDIENKSIEDYKFTGYSKYAKYPKLEHIRQLNILWWIWSQNNLPVERTKLHYIWRNLTPYQLGTEGYPLSLVETYDVKQLPIIDFIDKQLERHKNVINNTAQETDLECTLEERWGNEKYKVYKQSNNKKAIRVFDSYNEAENLLNVMQEMNTQEDTYYIKKVTTDFVRCENYCEYKNICHLYNKLIKDKNG